MITLPEAVELGALRITDNVTHPHYTRVTELATLYSQLITGEDQETLLERYFSKQSKPEIEKIKAVTTPITSSICNSLNVAFKKVLRVNPIIKEIDFVESTDEKKQEVEQRKDSYYGTETLEYYIKERFHELTFLDPNAWIVTEFMPFDNNVEKAKPFPIEVSSVNAVNYKRDKNVLQYLMVEYGITYVNEKQEDSKGVKLLIYLDNFTVMLTQVAKTRTDGIPDSKKHILLDEKEFTFSKTVESLPVILLTRDKQFTITYFNHKTGRVPAESVGYVLDKKTQFETFVSPIHYGAVNYLKKTIKSAAELDLTVDNHAFPRTLAYVESCSLDEKAVCASSGQRVDQCTVCGGAGFRMPTSSKDMLALKLPKGAANTDVIDLAKLIHFAYPPIDGIKFQDEYLDRLAQKCYKNVFNSDVFSKDEVQATATGKNIDLQNVYDTLYDYSEKVSSFWVNTVKMIAALQDYYDCIPKLKYPRDFKLKSVTELLADIGAATTNGAPQFVKNELLKDIAQQLYVDRPVELVRFEMKQKLYPFTGKSVGEINSGVAAGFAKKRDAVLWMYFDRILDDLEQESLTDKNNFDKLLSPDTYAAYKNVTKDGTRLWLYDLPYRIVQELMYARADQLAQEIEKETPQAQTFGSNLG